MSDLQQWHYADATGQQYGPITAEQFQQLVATGQITAETQVWTEGLEAYVPASQVEGLIPTAQVPPAATPTPPPIPPKQVHQPQINLGAGSGAAFSATPLQPTGIPNATVPVNPYANPKPKSPLKWIFLGVIALVVIAFGILVALAPSEEEKRANIPGYAEYSDANKQIGSKSQPTGNNSEAQEIAEKFSVSIKTYRELAIEKSSRDRLKKNKNGTFPTYCMVKTEGDTKTVVIIVQIPKLRKFADDAKEAIAEGAWISAKMALEGSTYDTPNTHLVVGLRGLAIYSKVMIGHPLTTENMLDKPLEGVTESHDGSGAEKKLYPFFEQKK